MSITFGGLATGLDTGAIIKAIMDVEREPLKRLESEKEYLGNRLEVFSQFEEKLTTLNTSIADMNEPDKLGSYAATAGTDEYFLLSTLDASQAETANYQVEVINLAQVQKDVSDDGYADRSLGNSNSARITITGTNTANINIASGSSLNYIREDINDANDEFDTGVTASIIFDGTAYRMVLSGVDANTDFDIRTRRLDLGGVDLDFSTTQYAELAEMNVDGIPITSSSNTINNAIPGISIDLLRENVNGESTTVNVDSDNSAISEKIQAFVSAYNDITNFVNEQKDADWGHDASFRSVRRTLQNLLVTTVGGTGNLNHLVDIGFKTNAQTGLISIDSAKLETALNENYDDFEFLLLGDETTTGIFEQFTSFLDAWTDNFDGLYAGKKQSHDSSIRSIEASIERLELRLEQREITLTNQFAAMEELVSGLNSTSTYLTQQMTMLAGLSQGGNN